MQRFAEGAHVQHPLRPRQAAQRRHALGGIAVLKFAVVVVFHHPGIVLARPLQQGLAAWQIHAHAGGELVRGRHHGHARGRPLRRALRNAQPAFIQRHGPCQRAVAQQAGADAGVARVFHQHLVAHIQQQARNQVNALLRARAHHHLRRIAPNAARRPQPLRHGLAQVGVARRVQVVGAGGALGLAGLARQAVPHGKRKTGHLGRANAKGPRRHQRRAPACGRVGHQLPALRQAPGRHCQRGGAGTRARGQGLRHIGAIAHAGLDIALGQQALHGPQHRVARYAQQPRMGARRRQPRARRPAALLDGAAQLRIHLLAQGGR